MVSNSYWRIFGGNAQNILKSVEPNIGSCFLKKIITSNGDKNNADFHLHLARLVE